MSTAEEIAARQEAQRAEGQNRQNPMDDQGNRAPDPRTDPSLETTGDPEPDAPRGGEDDQGGDRGGQEGRPKPIYMSPSDQKRAEMAKRFRRDEEGKVPYNGDPNDPEMQYGKFGRQDEPEPEIEPEPAPAPQARQQEQQPEKKYTIKVRGQDVHLTEAELLERASKVEAADSYLDEGRNLLEQARQLRRENRERDPADPHRPEDRTNAQDDHTDPSLSADPQHPEDELEGAIEEVRYGTDSKEAAKKLRTAISKEADKAADDRQIQRLIGNDQAKTNKAMKAFIEANPDLASDEIASQVMEQQIYSIQREELKQMGIDESKLPKDNKTLAQWHQFQRIHGHPVSSQEQILEKAKGRFVQWKGSTSATPQPAPRKDAPRVEVNVDRNARRAALPNQPTRSAAPPAQATRQNEGNQRSRSDVINQMRKARGQIVA